MAKKKAEPVLETAAKTPHVKAVNAAIDQILATLYANDISGYTAGSHEVLRTQAAKRIKEKINSLDDSMKKPIKSGVEYRLQEFDKFHTLSKKEREEIILLAKKQALSPEEAYRKAAK